MKSCKKITQWSIGNKSKIKDYSKTKNTLESVFFIDKTHYIHMKKRMSNKNWYNFTRKYVITYLYESIKISLKINKIFIIVINDTYPMCVDWKYFLFQTFSSNTGQNWCQETKSKETTFHTKNAQGVAGLIRDWFKSSVNWIEFLSNICLFVQISLKLFENVALNVSVGKYAHFFYYLTLFCHLRFLYEVKT